MDDEKKVRTKPIKRHCEDDNGEGKLELGDEHDKDEEEERPIIIYDDFTLRRVLLHYGGKVRWAVRPSEDG